MGPIVAALVAVVATSGCGSGGGSATTTTPKTVTWASSVCSAVTSYRKAVKNAGTALKSGGAPSKSDLRDAADSVKSATQTFVEHMKSLGPPGTESGQTAKETLTDLSSALTKDLESIQDATSGSSALVAVSAVSTTLLAAQEQVKSAVDKLEDVDAKGELKSAFSQAPSCAALD